MALLSFFVACLLAINGIQCQTLRDNVWVIGYSGNGTTFNFSTTPASISQNESPMTHYSTNASICDSLGNLLFYTNGNFVAGSDHQALWNGYGLDFGQLSGTANEGSNLPQGVMILPLPGSHNIYFIFYKSLINLTPEILTSKFYYSIVDMSKNQGKGMVVDKNHLVLEGYYLDWGKMTSCKHANGRDWWILLGESDSNKFHKFLFAPNGVNYIGVHEVESQIRLGSGQAVFSPDGKKHAILNLLGNQLGNDIDIFDFDRCEGELFNQKKLNYVDSAYTGGLAFSPNSRFLYVSSYLRVYQYDLEAVDIAASRETIAVYDGFQSPLWTNFYMAQLAPDGKVYICAPNGADVMHVINEPNEKGLACDMVQHGVQLPTSNAFSMPNFPYFNLGALAGSPCDTLGVSPAWEEQRTAVFVVSPNPASEQVTVRYELPGTSGFYVSISSLNGTELVREYLSGESGSHTLPIGQLANGMYFCKILENEKTLYVEKLAILR